MAKKRTRKATTAKPKPKLGWGRRPSAPAALRRADIVLRGLVRNWPDERTASAAGISTRTIRRYRRVFRGEFQRLSILPEVAKQRVMRALLSIDDRRSDILTRLDGPGVDAVGASALHRELTALDREEVDLFERLGLLDPMKAEVARSGGDSERAEIDRLKRLPPAERAVEVARIIELERESGSWAPPPEASP